MHVQKGKCKMKDVYLIPKSELGKGSNIKLNLCEHEVDMYWKVAIEVLETIEENNKKDYGLERKTWNGI